MVINNTKPHFPVKAIPQALEDIKTVLETNQFILGEKTREFEKLFTNYINTEYSISTNSATSSLQICLNFFDVRNKEVIVPTNTFLATPNSVLYSGGTPVLADIKKDTLCLDPKEIKKRITPNTKGVIIVYINGLIPKEIYEIKELCAKNNLFLIEDCAHAHGSELDGTKAGNFSDAGCFSFYPTKVMTTGVGGMITTNNKKLADFAISLRHHGQGENLNDIQNFGNDWVMTEINAILGIHQLSHHTDALKRRNEIADKYTEALSGNSLITIILARPEQKCAYYKYQILLDKAINKNKFKDTLLKEYDIKLGAVYWPTCHLQPIYKRTFNYSMGDFPVAEECLSRAVTLPLHTGLSDKDVDYVISCLQEQLSCYD